MLQPMSRKDWQSQDYDAAALLPMWYDYRNLTSYCKITWRFYFMKNKNSLAPQWYEIPIRAIYVDIFENLIHMLLVFALSVVKLFVTLVRFISCF